MKNLTSITEHSDYLENTFTFDAVKWDLHRKRVEFGKQALAIWMFTPCKLVDGVWVILSNELQEGMTFNEIDKVNKEYQQAIELCIFTDCVYDEEMDAVRNTKGLMMFSVKYDSNDIIEDLVKYELLLTATAQRQLRHE